MSGLEVVGAVAAASQLIEQVLKIVQLFSKFRDASESHSRHFVHIEQLIKIALLVKKNQPLHTAVMEFTLRQCLSRATRLLKILSKICAASGDGKVMKWKKALARVTKEKEILVLLAELEREKSSLTLCISTIDS